VKVPDFRLIPNDETLEADKSVKNWLAYVEILVRRELEKPKFCRVCKQEIDRLEHVAVIQESVKEDLGIEYLCDLCWMKGLYYSQ